MGGVEKSRIELTSAELKLKVEVETELGNCQGETKVSMGGLPLMWGY